MGKQDESSVAEAAYHEAGHALLICHAGYKIGSIEIKWNESEKRWDGNIERKLSNPRLQPDVLNLDVTPFIQESLIAVAGCLTQCMYLARKQDSKASFQRDQDWQAFLNWMLETNTEIRAPYPLQFLANGESIVIEAQLRSFGGRDQTFFVKVLQFIEGTLYGKSQFLADLLDQVAETAQLIGEQSSWDAIRKLAESLITVLKETGNGRIESDTVNELMIGLLCTLPAIRLEKPD